MFTGYFGKVKSYPKELRYVSVSRFCRFWTGERYLPLAPTPDMLKIESAAEYEKAYSERILAKLDPKKVYADLGDNAVLLCYEKWDDVKAGKKHCQKTLYEDYTDWSVRFDASATADKKAMLLNIIDRIDAYGDNFDVTLKVKINISNLTGTATPITLIPTENGGYGGNGMADESICAVKRYEYPQKDSNKAKA